MVSAYKQRVDGSARQPPLKINTYEDNLQVLFICREFIFLSVFFVTVAVKQGALLIFTLQ